MGTVDDKEIEHFKNLSEMWWNENSIVRGLHTYNSVRVPFVTDGLISCGAIAEEFANTTKPLRNLTVLDVGCGAGFLSEALAKLGCDTTGLDATEDLIKAARQHASVNPDLGNLKYSSDLIETHAEHFFEKYDAVVASEVIEHVSDQEMFVENCVKCLKPGGSIFFTTLNKTFAGWYKGIIYYEYIRRIIAKGTHQWSKFVSPETLREMLEKNNCTTRKVQGFSCSASDLSWKFSNNQNVFYGLHAVKAASINNVTDRPI